MGASRPQSRADQWKQQRSQLRRDAGHRKSILRLARAECLQLATAMQKRLPAELREVVYQFLCIEDRPIPVGPYYHFREYHGPIRDSRISPSLVARTSRHSGVDIDSDDEEIGVEDVVLEMPDGRMKRDHTIKPPSDMILPSSHIFNPRYMGPTISFEAQKLYYTSNTFSLCTVNQAIYHFLQLHTGYSMRRWKDGIPVSMPTDLVLVPPFLPRNHVQNLQIRIKAERLNSTEPLNGTDDEGRWALEKDMLQSIGDNLSSLHASEVSNRSCKSNVELVLMTKMTSLAHDVDGELDTRHFVNILEAIRSTVYTLVHDWNDCTVKITHVDDYLSPFPRDLTEIFSLPPTEWHHERLSCDQEGNECDAQYFVAPKGIRLRQSIHISAMDRLRERWGLGSALARRPCSSMRISQGEEKR